MPSSPQCAYRDQGEGTPARSPREGTELGLWSGFPREWTERSTRPLGKAEPQRRPGLLQGGR